MAATRTIRYISRVNFHSLSDLVHVCHNGRIKLACVAGVEGEGKGKKQGSKRVSVREGDLLLSSQYSAVVLTLSLPLYGLPRRLA